MSESVSQSDVAEWFDSTYREAGFAYLRPLAAYPIFVQLLGAEPGGKLLDVACGPGHLLKAASMRGVKATGADLSAEALELARTYVPEAEVHERNAEDLGFPDETFDYVTCVGAIERFFDREAALREMLRVAKPTARFCFMVRNASTLTWRIWRQFLGQQNKRGHQDALEIHEWHELFERVGFRVLDVVPDQWPRQRLKRFLPGGRSRDLTQPEPVVSSILPLRYANEFVFVMEKSAREG